MARRNRRDPTPPVPLSTGSVRRVEEQADGSWLVATAPARSDGRTFVCPVCGGRLASATAHLVVWREEAAVTDRRHVHTTCWRRRAGQARPVQW